jgi:hypothetical protein
MCRVEGILRMDFVVIGLTLATIFVLVLVALARNDAKS